MIAWHALFVDAKIEGSAEFWNVTIGEDANFRCAEIGGVASFEGVTIKGPVDFAFADADGLSLGKGKPTTIPTFRWSERGLANRCGITLRDLATAPEFWRFAQRMFEKEGERERADAAFYFSRLTRLSPWRVKREGTWKQQAVQILRRIGMLPGWLADCLFLRWPIGYGASLPRTIASWFVVLGGFTIVYATVPGALDGPRAALWSGANWAMALYSSVSVFVTLGMGAVQQTCPLGQTLIAVEGVLGALLMALTVAVVTRKFMR